MVRIPQYTAATLGAAVTSPAWNGRTGGIVVMDVAGQLNLNNQSIDVSGKGFRGGAGRNLAGGAGTNADYRTLSTINNNAQKGEGTAGTPAYVNNGEVSFYTGSEGYPSGSNGRGAPGNAGGGGTDGNPATNEQNSAGGGGANGGAGGIGGNSWSSNLAVGGRGGAVFAVRSGSRLVLGGGGGAGTTNNGSGTPTGGIASSGAAGGGIVLVRAGSVAGVGSISATGTNANNTVTNDGSGGGGAGGSVLVTANNTLTNVTVNARGGNGGSNTSSSSPHGPGGGGGGGVIYTNKATNAASSSAGGTAGTTTGGATFGAASGAGGTTNLDVTTLSNSASGAGALPNVTVTKTTTTPLVTRPSGGAITADYTITITNTGGAAQGITVKDVLPAGFTFNSHTSLAGTGYSYDDGGNINTGEVTIIKDTYVGPTAGATTVTYSSFTIESGGTLTINFKVNIATSATDNIYQNAATVTYLDPTRTTAQRKVSPATGAETGANTTYENPATVGPVQGSNYVAASSRDEDVTVNTSPVATNSTTAAAMPSTNGATPLSSLTGTDTSPGTVIRYIIKSIPNATTQGVLYKGAIALTVGSVVTAAEANTLTFDPVDAASGTITFTYSAVDNQDAESANAATHTLTVSNNPRPETTNITATAIPNTAAATAIAALQGTDTSPGTVTRYIIKSIPNATTQGVLYKGAIALTVGSVVTAAEANTLTFDPVDAATGNITFSYAAVDNNNAEDLTPATYTIPINRVPTATDVTNTPKISTSAPVTLLNPLIGTDTDGTVVSFILTTLPAAARGTLYVDGVLANINETYTWDLHDKISFKPNGAEVTNVTFTFRVYDNLGAESSTNPTFTIPMMLDRDLDGVEDANDLDSDNDGIPDSIEGTGDKDGDGIPDYLDLDSDGDGIFDAVEANKGKIPSSAIFNINTGQYIGPVGTNGLVNALETSPDSGVINYTIPDTDGDGIPDYLDLDSDNDGIPDNIEAQNAVIAKTGTDTNKNGVDTSYDPADGGTALVPVDTDGDGIPDYLDLDSDNDTFTDFEEAFDLNNSGLSYDDVTALATAFRNRAGANAAAGFYPAPPSPGTSPVWLQVSSGQKLPNLLVFNHPAYKDSNNDGLIDLFDARSFGETSVPNQAFRNASVNTVLPVTLVRFTAKIAARGVLLDWITATEEDNAYFAIERSTDSKNFVEIGRVQGAGNSSVRRAYTYTDVAAPAGIVYYRLKQVDYAGTYEYSNTLAVDLKSTATEAILLYPNPAASHLNIDLTGLAADVYTIRIMGMDGREVQRHKVSNAAIRTLDVSRLAAGKYILQVQNSQFVKTVSFIKM